MRPHHRLAKRKAYSCDYCGTHVYPLAGTIFEKSRTPLKSWFYAWDASHGRDTILVWYNILAAPRRPEFDTLEVVVGQSSTRDISTALLSCH